MNINLQAKKYSSQRLYSPYATDYHIQVLETIDCPKIADLKCLEHFSGYITIEKQKHSSEVLQIICQ